MRKKPSLILGLGGIYPWEHDAGACLVNGKNILALVEEERFVRKKKAFNLSPHNAIAYCLNSTSTNINDVKVIACGLTGRKTTARNVLPEQFAVQMDHDIPVVQIGHHDAHAASVFYTSPFNESAILVIDGQGDAESISIWKATEAGISKIASFGAAKSLGFLYGAIATYCGFGEFGGGKVMGLAPYGKPKYVDLLSQIYHSIKLPPDASTGSDEPYITQFLDMLYGHGISMTNYIYEFDPNTLKTRHRPLLMPVHNDLAASVQTLLLREVMQYAEQAKRLTDSNYLCLAGGVAMNCVTNSALQNSGIFEEIFVQPGCEDSGISLGSALAAMNRKVSFNHPYTGPTFTDEQIGRILKARSIIATRHRDIASVAARLLASNQVIGWFQGGLEYGPRALGNRSILANPMTVGMHDRVNQIKHRETWRPFGPSVLAERAVDLFESPHESKYMLRSFTVRKPWRERLEAVVHVDNSTRPQTVSRQDNLQFYKLLQAFDALTGIPAVLNTSFNDYDEPIVATPDDALRTFYTTGLDALVLGNYLITKSTEQRA